MSSENGCSRQHDRRAHEDGDEEFETNSPSLRTGATEVVTFLSTPQPGHVLYAVFPLVRQAPNAVGRIGKAISG